MRLTLLPVLLSLVLVGGCTAGSPSAHHSATPSPSPSATPTPTPTSSPMLVAVPDRNWGAHRGAPHEIEGYADQVSVLPGDPVRLFVSTRAPSYRVTAFRIGDYGVTHAGRVWRSGVLPGRVQAPTVEIAATRTFWAPWKPSLSVTTTGWPVGEYLFRLEASTGGQQYVPLTVRSASASGDLVIASAVTTWQAYNTWGGGSLYQGPNGTRASRSYAVSFDRPYATSFGDGSADLLGNELPLIVLAEHLHLPLAYTTDVDLDRDATFLTGARGLVSLGHDEYWTAAMRAHVTTARDHGMNIAFLGANAIFRHIRFAATALGPDRLEIDYKGSPADPMIGVRPADVTVDWRFPPVPRPESVLTGAFYECNPAHADMVAATSSSWLLAGIVRPGEHLHQLVGAEYDRVNPTTPTPRPLQILFHSPVTCGGRPSFSDATYYTTTSGAGVFDSGTSAWVCSLAASCGFTQAHPVVTAITTRLLTAMAQGPLGPAHPAIDNLAAYGLKPPPA